MRVGFFVTCLVDLMRPSIGFAAIRLLEAGGAEVIVPPAQTCCGQPGYNSGDRAGAIALARKLVGEFEACDYLVAPSGSCTGMIKTHYADLFRDDPAMLARGRSAGGTDFRADRFPGQRAQARRGARRIHRNGHLPRQLRGTARDGRQATAARAAGPDARRQAHRNDRMRDLLRLRWNLLDQVRRDRDAARGQQMRAHRRLPAPTRSCWAIWAACSTSRGGCAGAATTGPAYCTSPKCWLANRR